VCSVAIFFKSKRDRCSVSKLTANCPQRCQREDCFLRFLPQLFLATTDVALNNEPIPYCETQLWMMERKVCDIFLCAKRRNATRSLSGPSAFLDTLPRIGAISDDIFKAASRIVEENNKLRSRYGRSYASHACPSIQNHRERYA